MPTKLCIDEQRKVVWLLTKDDGGPYFCVGEPGKQNAVYSTKTGEFLGMRLELVDPKFEFYRVKKDAD